MKKSAIILLTGFSIMLTACSKMPKECEQSWENIADIAKKSGIPDDAIEAQKKEFERNVQEMPKDKAIEACSAQNSIFGMVK